MKRLLFVFAFIFTIFVFSGIDVCAKVSSSEVFEIEVGSEDTLNAYYTLEEDNEKNVKERINFSVTLKGLSEIKNDYRWEHTFCYSINEGEEICENDLTGSDQENKQYIYSNQTYNFTFYDGDMPYYNEDLFFDYVVFKNKFVCLDCDNSDEIILDDIRFEKEDINYKYNYDFVVSFVENEEKMFVNKSASVTFVNNSSSRLLLATSPKYNFAYEACVEEGVCKGDQTDKVYSGGYSYDITPYIGNVNFSYDVSDLISVGKEYKTVTYRIILECIDGCDSRRVDSRYVVEKEFNLDYFSPIVDESNTSVNSYDTNEYIKNTLVKITLKDLESGIDESSLKYYLGWNNNGSCSFSNVFSYKNGEEFVLGENLKDGAICMYYVASDKLGNKFSSDNYFYYFDNKGPIMTFDSKYDSSKYYNEVKVSPSVVDNYSGLKEIYYMWSKEAISKENYMAVKNNGKLFDNAEISSRELVEDGSYYLYVLSFDNLDNYSFDELGIFNVDTTGLEISEVIVETEGLSNNYSNTGKIKLTIDQISEGEEFKCGFFSSSTVDVSDLTVSCYNKQEFSIPSGYEGEYDLFVYVRDRANNYSLFKVLDNLKIDTKSPSIDYSILYDDDVYRIVNKVTVNVGDLSGVNEESLRYAWISKNKINVVSSNITNSFSSGDDIEYPKGYYGEYKLYILAVDNIGNEKLISLDKIFKIDTDIIHISLVGEKSITILKGEKYHDLGAVAYKGEVINGGRVSDVIVEGSVDITKEGVYYITYTSGEGELRVSVTREVIVESNLKYIVISASFFAIGSLIIGLRLFVKKKMYSNE